MKKELQKQYKAIKETIGSNIKTIRSLIKQAEALRSIVNGMSSDAEDAGSKEKLSCEIGNIDKSIEALVGNTEELFKLYIEFVETAFGE